MAPPARPGDFNLNLLCILREFVFKLSAIAPVVSGGITKNPAPDHDSGRTGTFHRRVQQL
jgi:hypothetical protein